MTYVDGFILPVPKDKLDAYFDIASVAGEVWKELGALQYIECVADDVKTGIHTSFPQSVKLEEGEVVVFSYIVYASREDRDRINDAVMKDPRLAKLMTPEAMPFDGKRLIYGGFKTRVAL
ncbi:DUF1428 domain-containing protein [Zhongshania sp. BJYM1]|uniref:DUF1428 domain-containing protein n=1 Tax=Zhongshania aquatica TaxID=2965069 RepID=UPI0022B30136|nr:DUF1428 domain-containing protein [Marortus sp. BJYM1]